MEQLKLARYFLDPRIGQGPKFLQFMTFPTLQASDRWIAANPQLAERLVRAVVKTLKRMREDPESAVAIIRSIIAIEKNTYYPTITEEAMRTLNQVQKQTGAVKGDVAYDKVVATQFLRIWEQ